MRDTIGCNCPCGRGSYRVRVGTAEGATVRDVGEAEVCAEGAVDGAVVGTLAWLGSALGVGALVADGVGAVVGLLVAGLLLAGGGARGTVGVTGVSW